VRSTSATETPLEDQVFLFEVDMFASTAAGIPEKLRIWPG